jgi:hypothetical protein
MLTFQIISGVLVAFTVFNLYLIRNLLIKFELYEDIIQDQTEYLQKLSTLIKQSDKHLKQLDERGVFQSDDELGEFFNQMKAVQKELSKFELPQSYGKEEIQG